MRYRDSLMHAKDTSYLIQKGYLRIVKDTMGLDDEDETESLDKLKKAKLKEDLQKNKPGKQSNDTIGPTEAILPNEKKKPVSGDSSRENQ